MYLTRCPTGNVSCPAGGFVKDANVYNFSTLYPAGFTPRFVGDKSQADGVLGVKGALDSGFTYDISGTMARNSIDLSMYGSLNASFGSGTQTSFELGELIQEELNANIDLTYPTEMGLASPVTLSAGGKYRRETYSQTAGDEQSYAVGFTVPRYDPTIISLDQIADIRRLAPNHRANISANWQSNGFAVTVRESYFGSWAVQQDYPGQTFGSKFTTDIDMS